MLSHTIKFVQTKSFVIGILLVQLYEYRKSQMTKGSKQLSHILMVEEAHRLLKNVSESGEGGNTRAKSVEFFCNLLAEIRTFGQGILIADQIPTKLAPDKVNEIVDTIRSEFPEVEITGIMLGIVSICYLGKPYEVHTLDITGQIIEHYKGGQMLPGGLEKARSIAMRGGYDFIEVYVDCCRAISSNGSVSVISC